MEQTPVRSNPRHVQIALCISVFLVPFMSSSLNLALPLIARDFSINAFHLTFVISMYLVGTTMLQMPAARLADILGRRRLFLAGLSAFGVFTLLCGLSWSGTSLIVFRFLSGMGSAFVFATNMAILTAVFPKEKRGQALGVNTAVVYFAIAAGPFLGGMLAHHIGWRSIPIVSFLLTVVAVVAGALTIRDEWAEARGEPFDATGSGVYALSLGGIVFGFSYLPRVMGWTLLVLGLVGMAVFVVIERRCAHPMLKLDIFRDNRNFRLSSLSAMINYSASFAIGFILSLYLQFVLGMTPDRAGLVLIAQPVTQSLLSPLGGWLSDRINPSILTTSGMGAITLGLFLLSALAPETAIGTIVLILILVGIGFGLFSSPNVNIIMGSVSRRDSGLASATTGTARQTGQSMSMAMTSLIVYAYMGDLELTRETAERFLPSVHTGFLIFAGICLVGMYTSASKLIGGDGADWRHVSGRFPAANGGNDDSEEQARPTQGVMEHHSPEEDK